MAKKKQKVVRVQLDVPAERIQVINDLLECAVAECENGRSIGSQGGGYYCELVMPALSAVRPRKTVS